MKKYLLLLIMITTLFGVMGCDNSDRNVSISLPSGTYYGEMHVTLSCVDPTAQITYTLDGSDPKDSDLIYDSETGIDINYTSDLKATAGGNIAEAHYDIIPYDQPMDATQKAFFDKAIGHWATDANGTDKVSVASSTITFEQAGVPKLESGYLLKDVNGDNATLIYTDAEGKNVEVPISVNVNEHQLIINGKVYYSEWYFF